MRNDTFSGYMLNHTMLRVKNLTASIDFYESVLGFKQIYREDFPTDGFTIVYLSHTDTTKRPEGKEQQRLWALSQPGVLELTHNHGTENKKEFSYHNGNSEPRGFGHICVTVPNLNEACERMTLKGVKFQKRPGEGRMKYVAFILDPDGYWIEILQYLPFEL